MNTLAERIANLSDDERALLLKKLGKSPESSSERIESRCDRRDVPLSYAQERLWFLNQLESDSAFYNIATALHLTGPLDRLALERAFAEIVRRHEVLRTSFPVTEGLPRQVIAGTSVLSVPFVDLSELPEIQQRIEVEKCSLKHSGETFHLKEDLLFRVTLLYLGQRESKENHVLLFAVHHIVFDGWSIGLLVNEFAILYDAFCRGGTSPLPPLPIQYADYAVWQREWLQGEVLERQLAYWRDCLRDAPTLLELPADRPRPSVQTYRGADHTFSISPELTDKLRRLCRCNGVTLFMGLFATFQTLLFRYNGQNDFCVGTPVANRTRVELESLIGFFVNTLVLRTDLSGNPTVAELLVRVRKTCLEAQTHQDLPFEKLVEELHPERNMNHNPLFQVMFVLQNTPTREIEIASLQINQLPSDTSTTQFDLSLDITETDEALKARFHYSTDLFDGNRIERMAEHFLNLLESMVTDPGMRLSELPLLLPTEHEQLTNWNATQVEYPKDKCIHQLFEDQVERTSEAIALVFENRSLTYRELNARANQLAHYLRTLAVEPDVLVGICVERSLEMVIGILGILRAGGAYLPLDPTYPQGRLMFMLTDAQPATVLTEARWIDTLPEHPQVICLDRDWARIAEESEQNLPNRTDSRNLAYVIYTSGSTGKPKGVGVSHAGLLNRLRWMQDHFELNDADAVLQKTPYSFDVSVWEFFWPLIVGARLIVAGPNDHKDPERLISLIKAHSVTTIHFVPSMLRAFLEATGANCCPTLKRVICSGEALTPELRQLFFSRHNAELHNLYGPTEASIDVTAWQCQKDDADSCVPIGRPIANTRTYILDRYFNPSPVGVPGELCLGGVQLARGYLNRPDLTAERFIPNPYGELGGERLYRTGDLACYRADGIIDYLGRIDDQVKIRGFRIELGEIEARLLQHPLVKEAVVIIQEGQLTDKRLVAYVVVREEIIGSESLREHLKAALPEYMVPAVFVFLQTLPLTVSGKLDRKALPAPDSSHLSTTGYIAPRNQVEKTLAGLWGGVLGIERIGIHDDFFALGGHSILATQLLFRIRDSFSCDLPLRDLFQAPTIASQTWLLAAHDVNECSNADSIDWKAESMLDEAVFPASQYSPEFALKTVLLTGATGFLGVFLLKELLQQTRMNIYCLVRSPTPVQGFEKIERSLDNYGLWDGDYASRIYPVSGDLSEPHLGIQPSQWQQLTEEIDAIYHNGALVNFVFPYSTLKPANVLGTQEVLRFACTAKVKPVHYISTVSVFEDDSNFDLEMVMEDDFPEDGSGLVGGYAQSKWVAEKMVRIAGSRGLPVSIYRPSIITGDSCSGVWNTSDYLSKVIGACLLLGKVPVRESSFNIVPVDYVSRALVFLSGQPKAIGKTYHLTNPTHLSSSRLVDWACAAGIPLERVDFDGWLAGLHDFVGNSSDHPFFSLIPILNQEEMNFTKNEDSDIRTLTYDCKNAVAGLSGTGIICPTPDERLWSVYFNYLQRAYAGHSSVAV